MALPLRNASANAARPSIRLAALRVPLAAKLVGANLLVVAILLGARLRAGEPVTHLVLATFVAVIVVHLALIVVALRPIRDLETVADRVWRGDYRARVAESNIADDEVLRIGSMFNILLDGLVADRARLQRLATQVLEAGDRERAAISRELQESTAQDMAALLFQLSAAARDAEDDRLADRLAAARDSAEAILEQVRRLSQSVHPAVLDDLGLEAALRKLVRDASRSSAIDIDVSVEPRAARLPRNVETVLYRVAAEAVWNATKHAAPRRIRITVRSAGGVTLEIHDDGRGFDLDEVDRRQAGTGIASMRERLALVDGRLEINTAVGNGTTVAATVPLDRAVA